MRGSRPCHRTSAGVYQVKQFREKPKADVAQQYLAAGTFYWNSGIFVWKAADDSRGDSGAAARNVRPSDDDRRRDGSPDYEQSCEREFTAIRGVSIDYAVMEHARDVLVIEAPFTWDDVGSWQAIARLQGTDPQGNTISARHLGPGHHGHDRAGPRRSSDRHAGVSDCIVVHTPEATLVANKHDEESIREMVKLIAEHGWREYL